MSSYQIKNGVGHRNFVELRHRRNNEQKRKFQEKKKMKKMIARASEGGSNALDAGRRMLGSVRCWAMTEDDEYFSHPAPPNAVRLPPSLALSSEPMPPRTSTGVVAKSAAVDRATDRDPGLHGRVRGRG